MFKNLIIFIFLFSFLINISANEKNTKTNKDNHQTFKFNFRLNQNRLYENINLYYYDEEDDEYEEEYSDESGIGQALAWAILFPFAVGYAFANNNEFERYPSGENSERRAWAWGAFGGGLAILLTVFIIFLAYSIIMEDFIIAAIGSTVLTGIYFITSMISIGLYADSVVNFFRYSDYYKEFCVYSFSANLGVLEFFAITAIIYWILHAEWLKIDTFKNKTGKNNRFIFDGQSFIFKF